MADIDIENLVKERLTQYGTRIIERIKERLQEQDKLASGDLYNSISFDVEVEGGIVSLNVYANDYFKWVDQGRPPGKQPPMWKILKWTDNRGIHPRSTGIPQRSFGLPRADRSLAFLIARKIGMEGIKPANILSTTIEEVNDPMVTDLTAIITQAIVDIIGKDLEDIAQQVNSSVLNMTVNYF